MKAAMGAVRTMEETMRVLGFLSAPRTKLRALEGGLTAMKGDTRTKAGDPADPEQIEMLLSFQIVQLTAKLNVQARAILARHSDLSVPQWRIIRVIGMGLATTSTPIRKAAGIDKSQFSKTVNALVEKGLVAVRPCAEDRRQSTLELTAPGWVLYRQIVPEMSRRNEHLLASLSPGERATIHGTLRALSAAVECVAFGPDINDDE
jgi:DNA-binding MarR family transcriptional regulator